MALLSILCRVRGRLARKEREAGETPGLPAGRGLGLLLLLAFWPCAATCAAETAPPAVANPRAVHAAFTLNLTRFVTWPEQTFPAPTSPIVIGTFARDPINAELDAVVRGEEVDGHPVRTIRIQTMDDLEKCHVVFISRGAARLPPVLQRIARKPILAISDADGFLELGGHVRFVPQPPRVGLRISVENLKKSGLECRAQLLRIAGEP